MKRRAVIPLVACWASLCSAPAWAASEADYLTAYAAASSAEADAGKVRNQWTSTEDALKAARKAAEAKNFDGAVDLANLAHAMAVRSIEQANEQAQAWRKAVVR